MTKTYPAFDRLLFQRWAGWLALRRQRRLLWWPALQAPESILPLLSAFPKPHVWVGDAGDALSGMHVVGMKQARTQLGLESGVVVFDARRDLDADALGAVAGTVVGGGVIVLLTNAEVSMASHSGFFRHLLNVLKSDVDTLLIASGSIAAPPINEALPTTFSSTQAQCIGSHDSESILNENSGWSRALQQAATSDQRMALLQIWEAPTQHLTVLTASRGRGKSTVLGLSVSAWLQDGPFDTLYLTAPRASAVEMLFKQLSHQCPDGRREGNRFIWGARTLCFVAPDALMRQLDMSQYAPDILLVDEAAALPQPFLLRWLSVGMPIVMATTLHGYEGSAQGFTHFLRQHTGCGTHVVLEEPVRWTANDPLERLTAKLLCLNATPARLTDQRLIDSSRVRFVSLSREVLLNDPVLLESVFGLLREAHYRTSPGDLQMLLDHKALTLWAGMIDDAVGQQIVAVLMAFDEGGLDEPLAKAVADGMRRPPGHLLPQTLALHSGDHRMATQRWRRITRIAVHPACQRQGIGAALLAHVFDVSCQSNIDAVGASFGGKSSTLAFWQKCGFSVLQVGLKRDTVTGEHAVMVGRVCHTEAILPERSFWATFPIQLAFELSALPPTLLSGIVRKSPPHVPELTQCEYEAVRRFGEGRVPLASVRPVLQRALLRHAAHLNSDECGILAGVLLQGHGDEWVCRQSPVLNGRRAVDRWLRERVAQWVIGSAC